MSGFSSIVHLVGRHPELVRNDEFRSWLGRYGGEVWHETHRSDAGKVTVVVQSLDRFHLFGALVEILNDHSAPDDRLAAIVRTAQFDLPSERFSSYHAAFALISKKDISSGQLQGIRPVVNFDAQPPQLSWEIETLSGSHVEVYRIDKGNKIDLFDNRILPLLSEVNLPKITLPGLPPNDWLESNELHHVPLFLEEARNWTAGATTVREKARLIWQNVRKRYAYDATISRIKEFTFADLLVRDRLGRAGICDEFAVVLVSYLRALGIPATIKLLNFQVVKPVGHACVEFLDEGRWVHADAVYNAFDFPAVYRESLATNVLVMDANFPRDDKSSEPAFGIPDVDGDLQFNPYTDFVLNPSYPGHQRPGYSY